MTSILKRHSFWARVIQSGQIILGSIQGITLWNENDVKTGNIIVAFVQAGLGIVSLWTADSNNNDIIDIVEPQSTVTVTAPPNVTVNVEETKPETLPKE